jgi:hypothetical protein
MDNHHFLMGKLTINMVIFNSYVKLPEGNRPQKTFITGFNTFHCLTLWYNYFVMVMLQMSVKMKMKAQMVKMEMPMEPGRLRAKRDLESGRR